MQRNKLEMTDRELCVVSAVGSDYAGRGSGLDLQGGGGGGGGGGGEHSFSKYLLPPLAVV